MYKSFLACGLYNKWAWSQIWPINHSLPTTTLNLVHLTSVHYLTTIDTANRHFLHVCTLCDFSPLTNYKEEIYNHLLW